MSRLTELEARFADAITASGARGVASELLIGAPDRMLDRIAIYRGNAYANWRKGLQSAYPVIEQLVGQEFFAGLAREYARANPSTCGDLNGYGDAFAEFLEGFPHTQDLPYLPDVAKLEWAVHRAFYAADSPRLDLARLADVREEELPSLRFYLSPACAIMPSRFPVVRIWTVHQPNYEGEIEFDIDAGGEFAFVHRPDYRVEVAGVDASQAAFLSACIKGDPVLKAFDIAVQVAAEFDLQATLVRWVQAGAIVGVDKV